MSRAGAVESVHHGLKAILKTLQDDEDHVTQAIWKDACSYRFLFLLHFMTDILAILAMVSKVFQTDMLMYTDAMDVVTTVENAVEEQRARILARRRFGDGRGRRVRPHRVGPRRHVDVVDPVGPKARFIL